jgi:hypothetical protein
MQLPRVEPKSAFHLSSTPSSMPSSRVGSSMWRRRSSLKARRASEGEWWETSAAGAGGEAGCGAERLETAAVAGERIWPSAWIGLVMPPSRKRAMCASAPRLRAGVPATAGAAAGSPQTAAPGRTGSPRRPRTPSPPPAGPALPSPNPCRAQARQRRSGSGASPAEATTGAVAVRSLRRRVALCRACSFTGGVAVLPAHSAASEERGNSNEPKLGCPYGSLLETDLVAYSDRCDAILPLGRVIGVSLKHSIELYFFCCWRSLACLKYAKPILKYKTSRGVLVKFQGIKNTRNL